MTVKTAELPTDVKELHHLVIEQNKKIQFLEEELRLAKAYRFGRSSDREIEDKQARLFNEAEEGAAQKSEQPTSQPPIPVAANNWRSSPPRRRSSAMCDPSMHVGSARGWTPRAVR